MRNSALRHAHSCTHSYTSISHRRCQDAWYRRYCWTLKGKQQQRIRHSATAGAFPNSFAPNFRWKEATHKSFSQFGTTLARTHTHTHLFNRPVRMLETNFDSFFRVFVLHIWSVCFCMCKRIFLYRQLLVVVRMAFCCLPFWMFRMRFFHFGYTPISFNIVEMIFRAFVALNVVFTMAEFAAQLCSIVYGFRLERENQELFVARRHYEQILCKQWNIRLILAPLVFSILIHRAEFQQSCLLEALKAF